MDLRQKALACFTVLGIVLAFAYFNALLGALAGIVFLPFLLMVSRQ